MKIRFREKFLHELAKLPADSRSDVERFIFEDFPANPSLTAWENIIPLKSNPALYKILFDDYRIGLSIKENRVIFERIRHRNDIYRIHA